MNAADEGFLVGVVVIDGKTPMRLQIHSSGGCEWVGVGEEKPSVGIHFSHEFLKQVSERRDLKELLSVDRAFDNLITAELTELNNHATYQHPVKQRFIDLLPLLTASYEVERLKLSPLGAARLDAAWVEFLDRYGDEVVESDPDSDDVYFKGLSTLVYEYDNLRLAKDKMLKLSAYSKRRHTPSILWNALMIALGRKN